MRNIILNVGQHCFQGRRKRGCVDVLAGNLHRGAFFTQYAKKLQNFGVYFGLEKLVAVTFRRELAANVDNIV